jgi:hypothetical protein
MIVVKKAQIDDLFVGGTLPENDRQSLDCIAFYAGVLNGEKAEIHDFEAPYVPTTIGMSGDAYHLTPDNKVEKLFEAVQSGEDQGKRVILSTSPKYTPGISCFNNSETKIVDGTGENEAEMLSEDLDGYVVLVSRLEVYPLEDIFNVCIYRDGNKVLAFHPKDYYDDWGEDDEPTFAQVNEDTFTVNETHDVHDPKEMAGVYGLR